MDDNRWNCLKCGTNFSVFIYGYVCPNCGHKQGEKVLNKLDPRVETDWPERTTLKAQIQKVGESTLGYFYLPRTESE